MPRVGEQRSLPGDAERFGILLHALLERRTENAETGDWWKMLGFDEGEYRRALPVAERLLVAPGLQRFFDSSQYCRAWNEIDLASGDGVLRRIDRLVVVAIDPGHGGEDPGAIGPTGLREHVRTPQPGQPGTHDHDIRIHGRNPRLSTPEPRLT